jgi:hypothetical protein
MEAVMVGSNWEDRVRKLEEFLEVREVEGSAATMTLQATFLERSIDELPDLVDFAIDRGIDRLKGHHLWAFYDEIKDDDMRKSQQSREYWNDIVRKCHSRATARPLPKTDRQRARDFIKLENFDLLPLEDSREVPSSFECPFLGKEAWISPEESSVPVARQPSSAKRWGILATFTISLFTRYGTARNTATC